MIALSQRLRRCSLLQMPTASSVQVKLRSSADQMPPLVIEPVEMRGLCSALCCTDWKCHFRLSNR